VKYALLALLCACGGGKDEQPADCSTVSNGIKQYWGQRTAGVTDVEELAAIHEQMKTSADKFERHCRADQWNPEMIACTRAVFRLEDSGCMKFMSNQQKARWLDSGDAAPIKGGMGIGN